MLCVESGTLAVPLHERKTSTVQFTTACCSLQSGNKIRPSRSVDSAISGKPEKTEQDDQRIRPANRILPGTD